MEECLGRRVLGRNLSSQEPNSRDKLKLIPQWSQHPPETEALREIRDPLEFLGERDAMITSEIDKRGQVVSFSKPH